MLPSVLRPILRPGFGLLAVLLAIFSASCLHAQTPILEEPDFKPTLTFDIVSIRPSPPPDANFHLSVSSPPHSSRFEVSNFPIKGLIQIAYGYDAPVVGLPDWASSTFYTIQCRSDEAADDRLAKLTANEVRLEKRNAIRVLLDQRFDLNMHLETRNTLSYNLVVAKGGVKMQAVPAPPAPAPGEAPAATPAIDIQAHGGRHGLELVGAHAPARAITGTLSSMVQAPVIDKTGLLGTYNFTLQIGRDWSANDPDSWPSIFTAVEEQLGLKLEAVHESVPNLVVDHITRPTEN